MHHTAHDPTALPIYEREVQMHVMSHEQGIAAILNKSWNYFFNLRCALDTFRSYTVDQNAFLGQMPLRLDNGVEVVTDHDPHAFDPHCPDGHDFVPTSIKSGEFRIQNDEFVVFDGGVPDEAKKEVLIAV